MLRRWILASCIGLAMAGQVRPAHAFYVEEFNRVVLNPIEDWDDGTKGGGANSGAATTYARVTASQDEASPEPTVLVTPVQSRSRTYEAQWKWEDRDPQSPQTPTAFETRKIRGCSWHLSSSLQLDVDPDGADSAYATADAGFSIAGQQLHRYASAQRGTPNAENISGMVFPNIYGTQYGEIYITDTATVTSTAALRFHAGSQGRGWANAGESLQNGYNDVAIEFWTTY